MTHARLTGRGDELLAPFASLRDDPDCAFGRTLAALDSTYPIDTAVVADSDITPEALTNRWSQLLQRLGWARSLGPDDSAEIAHGMASDAAEAAAQFPVGTRLRARFERPCRSVGLAPQ